MKKTLTILGLMSVAIVYGQEQKVGINTDKPKATLDIMVKENVLEIQPQGVIFPRIRTMIRERFIDVKEGTLIYNTTKKCIELYKGVNTGGDRGWFCLGNIK